MVPSLHSHPTTCRRPSLHAPRAFAPRRPEDPPTAVAPPQNRVGARQELGVPVPKVFSLPSGLGSAQPGAGVGEGRSAMRSAIAKRCVDVVVATLLLIVMLPVIA